ncbi:MAG: hypothetical protein H7645_02685 [Candidatus Heimdallarchaeota archaeon]|nr:hypothetical protein [Candidatus Heimdallarchaeota archaeon]MCK4769222.1 hypothetical protein [Candidatus Heimdallarchaeota archaeon]
MKKTRLILIILGISSLILLTIGITFYMKYATNVQNGEEVIVTAIIDYGSLKPGAEEEYNVTIQTGHTALQVFTSIAELDLLNYSFGAYIRGVNGYSEQLPNYWGFYYFDFNTRTWAYSAIGVDQYRIEGESKIKLEYTG